MEFGVYTFYLPNKTANIIKQIWNQFLRTFISPQMVAQQTIP